MGLRLEDVAWSNADEVEYFIEEHTNRKYAVGETLVLPDIDQTYVVKAVRPFRHNGDFHLFLDLEAECAVQGCTYPVGVSVEVHRWRKNRHMPRCCPVHRYKFATTMPGAWKTMEEREALVARSQQVAAAVTKAAKVHIRAGHIERAVLRAETLLSVVSDRPTDAQLVAATVPMLSRPAGRDTRKQKVVRAIAALRQRGLLFAPTGAT